MKTLNSGIRFISERNMKLTWIEKRVHLRLESLECCKLCSRHRFQGCHVGISCNCLQKSLEILQALLGRQRRLLLLSIMIWWLLDRVWTWTWVFWLNNLKSLTVSTALFKTRSWQWTHMFVKLSVRPWLNHQLSFLVHLQKLSFHTKITLVLWLPIYRLSLMCLRRFTLDTNVCLYRKFV